MLVPERWIRSTVSDGWVELEGEVDYYFSEKEDAERTIQYLPGVRGVTNEIRIRMPKVLPREFRKAIEEATVRHAHRRTQTRSIPRLSRSTSSRWCAERSAFEMEFRESEAID